MLALKILLRDLNLSKAGDLIISDDNLFDDKGEFIDGNPSATCLGISIMSIPTELELPSSGFVQELGECPCSECTSSGVVADSTDEPIESKVKLRLTGLRHRGQVELE